MSELLLARAVEVGDVDLGRLLEQPNGVGHLAVRLVVAEPRQTALSFRDLLHRPAARGHTEQVRGTADAAGEIDVFAVLAPERALRDVAPRSGKIDLLAAACGQEDDVRRAAMAEMLADDRVVGHATRGKNPAAVRRVARGVVLVIGVGCETVNFSVGDGNGPDFRAPVRELFAVLRVRGEEQRRAVLAPLQTIWPKAELRELTLGAATWRRDEEILRRIDFRVVAVRQRELAAVLMEGQVVELHALEMLLVPLLEICQ